MRLHTFYIFLIPTRVDQVLVVAALTELANVPSPVNAVTFSRCEPASNYKCAVLLKIPSGMTNLLANVADVLRHRYIFSVLNLLVIKSVFENLHHRRGVLNYNLQFHAMATVIVFVRNLWCLFKLHFGFEPAHVCNLFILTAMCIVQNYLRDDADVGPGGVLMFCVTGLLLQLSFNNPVEKAIRRIADWTQFESKRVHLMRKLLEMQERCSAELESECASTGYPGMSDVETAKVAEDNRSVTSDEVCSTTKTKDQGTQVDVSCASKGSQYLKESSIVAGSESARSSCGMGGPQNWILLNFAGNSMMMKDSQKPAGDFNYPKQPPELCPQPANQIFVAQSPFKDPDIVNIEDLMGKSTNLIAPHLKRVSSSVMGAIETIYLRPWSWSEVNSECRSRGRK